jgi:hypothetical protein
LPGARWLPNYLPIAPAGMPGSLWEEHLYAPAQKKARQPVQFFCRHNYLAGKGLLQIRLMFDLLHSDRSSGFDGLWTVGESRQAHVQHCLEKKQHHVCIDNITQGFIGMAGWEALTMGMPVIARLDEFALDAYSQLGDGRLPPILNARWIDEVCEYVLALGKNPEWVQALGQASRDWMIRHYNGRRIIALYEEIYKESVHARMF